MAMLSSDLDLRFLCKAIVVFVVVCGKINLGLGKTGGGGLAGGTSFFLLG